MRLAIHRAQDFNPPPDAAGDLNVAIVATIPDVSARLVVLSYFAADDGGPSVCYDETIALDPNGSGQTTIPVSRDCRYAVLILAGTDPIDSPGGPVGWAADFNAFALSPVGSGLGEGRSMAVLNGYGYYIPVGDPRRICRLNLSNMTTEPCGQSIVASPEFLLSLGTADGKLYALSSGQNYNATGSHLYEISTPGVTIAATLADFGGTNRYRIDSGYRAAITGVGDEIFVGPMFDTNESTSELVILRYTPAGGLAARYSAHDYAGLGWAGNTKAASDGTSTVWIMDTTTIYKFPLSGGEPSAVFYDPSFPHNTSGVYADGAYWVIGRGSTRKVLKIDPASNATLQTIDIGSDSFNDIIFADGNLYVRGDRTIAAIRASDGSMLGRIDLVNDYGLGSANSLNLELWDDLTGKVYFQVSDFGVPYSGPDSNSRLLGMYPSELGGP